MASKPVRDTHLHERVDAAVVLIDARHYVLMEGGVLVTQSIAIIEDALEEVLTGMFEGAALAAGYASRSGPVIAMIVACARMRRHSREWGRKTDRQVEAMRRANPERYAYLGPTPPRYETWHSMPPADGKRYTVEELEAYIGTEVTSRDIPWVEDPDGGDTVNPGLRAVVFASWSTAPTSGEYLQRNHVASDLAGDDIFGPALVCPVEMVP